MKKEEKRKKKKGIKWKKNKYIIGGWLAVLHICIVLLVKSGDPAKREELNFLGSSLSLVSSLSWPSHLPSPWNACDLAFAYSSDGSPLSNHCFDQSPRSNFTFYSFSREAARSNSGLFPQLLAGIILYPFVQYNPISLRAFQAATEIAAVDASGKISLPAYVAALPSSLCIPLIHNITSYGANLTSLNYVPDC